MIAFNNEFQLNSDVRCSDKSLTHRALIAAAIADGESKLHNVTLSNDVKATVNALCPIARISIEGEADSPYGATVTVKPRTRMPKSVATVDCGNSGTTARLMAGLYCGLGLRARFVGDKSLSNRPMDRVIRPLRKLGADIVAEPDCLFATRGGRLVGADLTAEVQSAQVKSAVILAGLFAEGVTRYTEQMPTRDHTEIMLRNLGADVVADGNTVTVRRSRPRAFELSLPNDPSAVAYSVALALLTDREATFVNVLLNERRTGFFRVLNNGGANIIFENVHSVLGEKVGDVSVRRGKLAPFYCTAQQTADGIDEIPLLATAALFVKGTHTFCGASELARKECDRIEAIRHIARVCGQQCVFDGNDLVLMSDGAPTGKYFCSFGDHRIAMCQTVLSVAAGGGCVDSAPFEVSDPNFLSGLGIVPHKFGLVGTNISGSLSPRLIAHLALKTGVCCSYDRADLPRDVSDSELTQAIGKFDGANVTMPFKKRVAALFRSELPSVNTVFHGECFSTDGYGAVRALTEHNADFARKSLWIVGAGGAAEACIAELLKYGCKLRVVNRTVSEALTLKQKYALPDQTEEPVGVLSFVPQCEFEQNLPLPDSCRFVFVADYKGASGLRDKAIARGLQVIDGLEMLYHQGAKSFSLWTGVPVQSDYASFVADLNVMREEI